MEPDGKALEGRLPFPVKGASPNPLKGVVPYPLMGASSYPPTGWSFKLPGRDRKKTAQQNS